MKLPEGVGLTALVAAYARAQESRRPDRLFDDPVAELFVTAAVGATEGGRLPRLGPANEDGDSELWNGLHPILSSRTPFYDKHILRGVLQGCRQLVLLGAGLDARAFRLDLPTDMAGRQARSVQVLLDRG
jgi:methyltransferase (TIGR00027 family)